MEDNKNVAIETQTGIPDVDAKKTTLDEQKRQDRSEKLREIFEKRKAVLDALSRF